jgi:hypothetical protein
MNEQNQDEISLKVSRREKNGITMLAMENYFIGRSYRSGWLTYSFIKKPVYTTTLSLHWKMRKVVADWALLVWPVLFCDLGGGGRSIFTGPI